MVVLNTETKTAVNLKTGPNGRYLVSAACFRANTRLPPKQPGLRKKCGPDVVLLTADVRNVDFTLQVGVASSNRLP